MLVLGGRDIVVLGGATREPAGGGSGGKLDGGKCSGTADGRVEDGSTGGGVEHKRVGTDDFSRGGTRIGPLLDLDGRAGMLAGAGHDVAEYLLMAGP